MKRFCFQDAVNKAIPAAAATEPERPVPAPPSTAATTSSSTSTPEDLTASNFNPFSSSGGSPFNRAAATVSASSGPGATQSAAASVSPPILVDDSPTVSFPRPGLISADADYFAGPSSSYQARTRMLEFNIQHNNRMIQLKVPDSEDLKTLKELLQSETGFPPSQQDLRGFKVNVFPMSDHRKLNEMNLPKENFLYLLTPGHNSGDDISSSASNGDPSQPVDDEDADFVLQITDEAQHRDYSLNFRRKI